MGIRDINVHMTGNAVHAIDQICKNLKFLVLQTGTNVSRISAIPETIKSNIASTIVDRGMPL